MSSEQKEFKQLVSAGHPVGEIVAVDRFLVRVKGLQPVNTHALVMFEDGSQGYVHHIYDDYVLVMHLGVTFLRVGMVAVVRSTVLVTGVGKQYIGRVISPMGEPLDGKGPIEVTETWPVFNNAPMLYERELLDTQLETGVTAIDNLFSLVRGQRMTIVGDGKSGKSALASQIAFHQHTTDIITIYVLIAKRQSDVTSLLARLKVKKALDKAIVVVSTITDSLATSFLAPYIACSIGEYLWQKCDIDTLIIYDDLTAHAQVYREMSLLAGVSPGRDSYPGDMFYVHSSLVERAGKLVRNHKTQTILPLVYAANGDVTAYLPTNIMSMTDGQWILDMNVFRDTMRPAINTGLSVTRVGGVGQTVRQKQLAGEVLKSIAAFRQVSEYAHFGAELSGTAQFDLETGTLLFELMNQVPDETYDVMSQQLMLDVVLRRTKSESVSIASLKELVVKHAGAVKETADESNYDTVLNTLKTDLHAKAKK